MEILAGVVIGVAALIGLGILTGDDRAKYEEYRRTEYRNEYISESKKPYNGDNYSLDYAMLRRRP
jgi:hypothetical protein